jgi:regulator of sirC expression with transglutaminase-like and TPR domain
MDPAARFAELIGRPAAENHLDLMAALIGAAFEPGTDVGKVVVDLDHLAAHCQPTFESILTELFRSGRLRGNTDDYSDPRNSYLHQVLHRGLGIPITLSVCAIEVGRRLDVPVHGVGLPAHFMVVSNGTYADPFHGGRCYTADELEPAWQRITGLAHSLDRPSFQPMSTRAILLRMLNNLKQIFVAMDDPRLLRILVSLRTAFPELEQERSEYDRWLRHWN